MKIFFSSKKVVTYYVQLQNNNRLGGPYPVSGATLRCILFSMKCEPKIDHFTMGWTVVLYPAVVRIKGGFSFFYDIRDGPYMSAQSGACVVSGNDPSTGSWRFAASPLVHLLSFFDNILFLHKCYDFYSQIERIFD